MQEKIAEIIELIEAADDRFNQLPVIPKEALTLWKSGIEKLAGSIWIYERGGVEPETQAEEELV